MSDLEFSFNEDYIKSVSKKEFLENEKYLADFIDLGEVYDKINPPKQKEKPTPKTESADEK